MRTANSYIRLAALVIGFSLLSACSTPSAGAGDTPTETDVDAPPVDSSAGNTSTTSNTVSSDPAAAPAVAEDRVRLIPVSGTVTLLQSGAEEFEAVTTVQMIGEGDIVRTGADGNALLVFADNTEAALSPNSQLAITKFQDQGGVLTIGLLQYIGSIFHRANFETAGSSYEVKTPVGIASIGGTAFYSDVIFDAIEGLSPEEAEELINSSEFFQQLGFDPETIEAQGGGTVKFDISSGQVVITYIDDNGVTQIVTLEPGQTITLNYGENDCEFHDEEEQCEANFGRIGVTDRGCGDGVCDPYLGEDSATCSQDC